MTCLRESPINRDPCPCNRHDYQSAEETCQVSARIQLTETRVRAIVMIDHAGTVHEPSARINE